MTISQTIDELFTLLAKRNKQFSINYVIDNEGICTISITSKKILIKKVTMLSQQIKH